MRLLHDNILQYYHSCDLYILTIDLIKHQQTTPRHSSVILVFTSHSILGIKQQSADVCRLILLNTNFRFYMDYLVYPVQHTVPYMILYRSFLHNIITGKDIILPASRFSCTVRTVGGPHFYLGHPGWVSMLLKNNYNVMAGYVFCIFNKYNDRDIILSYSHRSL